MAVDGPFAAGLDLVEPVADRLLRGGRATVTIDCRDFLRPASLRLERGRDDPDAYYEDRYDTDGLRREVLEPLSPAGSGRFLPALWDARRDRAVRASYRMAPPAAVALVRGEFLLATPTRWDLAVHLQLSAAALARRTPPDLHPAVLPAHARYRAEAAPAARADLVVRCDHPDRPAALDRRGVTG